jgi:hypothetical protein
MGARSSPEGYRIAVGRYGLPVQKRATMQRLPILGVFLVPMLLASCSGGGGGGSSPAASASGRAPACAFIAKLDVIANAVAQADVHDPDTFNKTLATAVRDYVTNVRGLKAVAPTDLKTSLDRVQADVQQYRFTAALTDRAALDAYASRTCGRVVQAITPTTVFGATTTTLPAAFTTTTVAGATTTTVAGATTTTVSGDSTTTTAPSDG